MLVQPLCTVLISSAAGLRQAMRLAAALSFACCALRLLPGYLAADTRRSPWARAALHAAQILNAAAGPLIMSSCSHVAAVWFPPERRATATAVAYLGGNVGSAVGFALGPLVIANVARRVQRLMELDARIQECGDRCGQCCTLDHPVRYCNCPSVNMPEHPTAEPRGRDPVATRSPSTPNGLRRF